MSIANGDIFPRYYGMSSDVKRFLEPHKCLNVPTYSVATSMTDSQLIFRKKTNRAVVRLTYTYTNIFNWEYRMLETFYHQMKGSYDDFYVVDWRDQYIITAIPQEATDLTFDRVTKLQSRTGYIGNKVLLYNPTFTSEDPRYEILTIANDGIDNLTVTFDAISHTYLRTTASRCYILYPCIFETDSLNPTSDTWCTEHSTETFEGYGSFNIYGPLYEITIPFISLGTIYE